ncbi:MAG: hypothetical protein LBL86_03925, partial [Coriobacteriales bacterium]|nr:hypothetical protein [Coriobacteriales bacterium]
MNAPSNVIPPRLCSQACYFAWHICLLFVPFLAYSLDTAFLVVVVGRLAFLAAEAAGLVLGLSIERRRPGWACGARPL